jgi:hypothetical protein
MKHANLRRGGRAVGLSANRANESHVASPRSDPSGADCPIPRGIAMLIDILALEALKDVIAEHRKLQACGEEREEAAQTGTPNEIAITDSGVIKTKSCPQQDSRQTYLIQQNQIDIKIKSALLVAGGGFDLYITHTLTLPIVLASLTHCPH